MNYIDEWIKIINDMRTDKTYKPVWGLSIIKCIKDDMYLIIGDVGYISLNDLYVVFIEYYWNNFINFGLSQGSSSSIMSIITRMQEIYINEFGKIHKWEQAIKFFKEDKVLLKIYINKMHNVCKSNVIPRFLVVSKGEQKVYNIDLKNRRLIFDIESIKILKNESTYLQRILIIKWIIIFFKYNKLLTLQYGNELFIGNQAAMLIKEKFLIRKSNYIKEKTYEDYIFTYRTHVFSLLYFFDSACVEIEKNKMKNQKVEIESVSERISIENKDVLSSKKVLIHSIRESNYNVKEEIIQKVLNNNFNNKKVVNYDSFTDIDSIGEPKNNNIIKKQYNKNIEYYEGELYYCSVFISIPVVALVRKTYDFVIQGNVSFRDTMLQLRKDFKVNNMNTKKLKRLILRFFKDTGHIIPIYEKDFYYPNSEYSEEIKMLTSLYNLIGFFGEKNFLEIYFQKSFSAFNHFIEKDYEYDYTLLDKFVIPFTNILNEYSFNDFQIKGNNEKIAKLYKNLIKQYNDLLLNYDKYLTLLLSVCKENLNLKLEVIGIDYNKNMFDENNILSLVQYLKGDTYKNSAMNFLEFYKVRLEKLVLLKEILKYTDKPLLQVIVNEGYKYISKNAYTKRLKMVAYKQTMTLQEIGDIYGVTRERVRQIVKQTSSRLQMFLDTYQKNGILSRTFKAMFKYEYCITSYELFLVFGDFGTALFYSIKKENQGYGRYLDKLDCICLGDDKWYYDLLDIVNKFPSSFHINEIDELIANYDYDICREIILKTLKTVYKNNGNVFAKLNMNKSDKTLFILKTYFKNGFKIRDDSVIKKYKAEHYKVFSDETVFDQSARSIEARIEKKSVSIGKALYTHPDNILEISVELISQIENYVDNVKPNIVGFHYKSIFLKFEKKLIFEGITDPYMLREIMKKQINKYFYDRDSFSKTYDNNLFEDLLSYCREFKGVFDIRKLVEKHFSYNLYFVQNQLSAHPEFVILYGMKAIKLENIKFLGLKSEMKKLIDLKVENGKILHSRTLNDLFNIKFSEFMDENNIKISSDLFNIMKKVFSNRYNFRKPYIVDIKTKIDTTNNMINDYLNGMKFINISNFKIYLEDNGLRINSFFEFITSLCDRYAWIEREKLIAWNQINLDETKVNQIKNILELLLSRKPVIEIENINFDIYFPELNVKYTELLIVSLIRRNFKEFRLISTINQYPIAHFYVIKNDSQIRNYQDIKKEGIK